MISITITIEQLGEDVSFFVAPSSKDSGSPSEMERHAGGALLKGIDAILETLSDASGSSKLFTSLDGDSLLKVKQAIKDSLKDIN